MRNTGQEEAETLMLCKARKFSAFDRALVVEGSDLMWLGFLFFVSFLSV